MKKYISIILFVFGFTTFAQSVNDYPYVIVPTKFEFQKNENDYRLNTLTKFNLEKLGFTAYYSKDNLGMNYNDRCNYLTVNVKELNGLFTTKLEIVFIDCKEKVVFTSKVGTSKQKDRKIAYTEALDQAFESVKSLNYKYNGTKQVLDTANQSQRQDKPIEVAKVDVKINPNQLFAQPISNGFQLVDTTPKVVLKMFKTSQTDYFTAVSDTKNGVVFKKNNEWFFEYYENDKPVSEKLDIKF